MPGIAMHDLFTRSRRQFFSSRACARNLANEKGMGVFMWRPRATATHQLEGKAALSLPYKVLASPNPFAECVAPKLAHEKNPMTIFHL